MSGNLLHLLFVGYFLFRDILGGCSKVRDIVKEGPLLREEGSLLQEVWPARVRPCAWPRARGQLDALLLSSQVSCIVPSLLVGSVLFVHMQRGSNYYRWWCAWFAVDAGIAVVAVRQAYAIWHSTSSHSASALRCGLCPNSGMWLSASCAGHSHSGEQPPFTWEDLTNQVREVCKWVTAAAVPRGPSGGP